MLSLASSPEPDSEVAEHVDSNQTHNPAESIPRTNNPEHNKTEQDTNQEANDKNEPNVPVRRKNNVDVEVHTQVGHMFNFHENWR